MKEDVLILKICAYAVRIISVIVVLSLFSILIDLVLSIWIGWVLFVQIAFTALVALGVCYVAFHIIQSFALKALNGFVDKTQPEIDKLLNEIKENEKS